MTSPFAPCLLWVTGCLPQWASATAGVPQITADFDAAPQVGGPEPKTAGDNPKLPAT
jgi:hypothetical protein